jgi:ABC-2 type transport system ATP-binding protein
MDIFNQRLNEIARYYQNGDYNLGFRRLIDSAMDTGNTEILKDIINYTDWRYKNPEEISGDVSKALDLLNKIRNLGPKIHPLTDRNIIDAKNVSKRYARGNFQLGPLDVSIRPHEVVGLVGENGNGKTTLLRLLAGELKPDQGKIDYHFRDEAKDHYDLRTKLVYIPQRIEVLRGGLMDNLQFTLTNHGLKNEDNYYRAQASLARMGLWEYKELNWARLSSGYKMRFELARTLVRQPEVLLLDEPLANLDILAQQIILEDLKYLAESLYQPFGVVLSSQQLYEVEKVSDKIIYLEKGKLVNDSSKEVPENTSEYLILELESSFNREDLQTRLGNSGLERLQYNGGNYILFFKKDASMNSILKTLGEAEIPVTYLRDISHSSRRFFIN